MLRTAIRTATLLLTMVISANAQTTGQRVKVNGMQMYYEVSGSGEPLIVLHGAYMNIPSMGAIIPKLAKTHRVYALELQGQSPDLSIQRSHLCAQPLHIATRRQVQQMPQPRGRRIDLTAGHLPGAGDHRCHGCEFVAVDHGLDPRRYVALDRVIRTPPDRYVAHRAAALSGCRASRRPSAHGRGPRSRTNSWGLMVWLHMTDSGA